MKKISICDKEYEIDCNAFTRFQYKKVFDKGIFEDIKILSEFSQKQNNLTAELKQKGLNETEINEQVSLFMMENLDDFIDVIERIAYILIYTANSNIESFEDWLKGIDKIDLSASWITEVTEFAVSSFC